MDLCAAHACSGMLQVALCGSAPYLLHPWAPETQVLPYLPLDHSVFPSPHAPVTLCATVQPHLRPLAPAADGVLHKGSQCVSLALVSLKPDFCAVYSRTVTPVICRR